MLLLFVLANISTMDLFNISVLQIILFYCFYNKLIPTWLTAYLAVTMFTPFFTNNFLFPTSYMPDQLVYYNIASGLRDFDFHNDWQHVDFRVRSASLIFAITPIPIIDGVTSLSIVNRLYFLALAIWLYSFKNLRNLGIVFLLLYRSFSLYSSLA